MGTDMETVSAAIGESKMVPMDHSALTAELRAEVDIQISTAKKYPRQITAAKNRSVQLATLDEDTASRMFYTLERMDHKTGKKKQILGPSIRLAEIVASSWGNIRYGAKVVDVNKKTGFVTAMGMCHDLETNLAYAGNVERRITGKNGQVYGDDMIGVTGNAACSIALRNAVFRVIPFALVKPIYLASLEAAAGKGTMNEKRNRALKWFNDKGKKNPEIYAVLGVKGFDDITVDELLILKGFVTAIEDGETTVDNVFAIDVPSSEPGSKIQPSSVRKPAKSDIDALKIPQAVREKAIAAGVKTAGEFHAAVLAGQKFGRNEDENEALFAESSMQSGG